MPLVDGDEDLTITEEQILSEGLLVEEPEQRIIVVEGESLFAPDGTIKVAVIRPCVSRGKRLRGLPPIYTPSMLAESAGVFGGWLMYMDHLTERIVETLRKKGRSITDLGGRVVESHWDTELTFSDDAEFGYRKGGVVGKVKPQPKIREMLEADPEILHVSINAYPQAVKPGTAPWNPQVKGMLVEGIRKRPPGSVDWVPRGGAGGRVLQEVEDLMVEIIGHDPHSTVSVPEVPHNAAPGDDDVEFKDMTREQLVEKLRADNPDLARELNLAPAPQGGGAATAPAASPAAGTLTEADLDAKLAERDAQWQQRLEEASGSVEERAEELLAEREQSRVLERKAHAQIKRAGLPTAWTSDLLRRYSVLPSGPTPALDVEPATVQEDDKTVELSAEQVLERRVTADLKHAAELLAEAGGGRRGRVVGLGGNAGNEGGDAGGNNGNRRARGNSFLDFLRESGDKIDGEGDGVLDLKGMVREGVSG